MRRARDLAVALAAPLALGRGAAAIETAVAADGGVLQAGDEEAGGSSGSASTQAKKNAPYRR